MSDYIKSTIDEGVQTVRITRVEKRNALTLDMYSALTTCLRQADERKDILVTVITGSEGVFCSGNDIKEFLEHPMQDDSSPIMQFILAIFNAEKPVIAGVNGLAVGIGTTMLFHCDLVYATESATFQLPFVNLGLCPEAGSTAILTELIGHQKASELLLLGDSFDVNMAKQMGFVNQVVSDNELEPAVAKIARRISRQAPNAIKVTKNLLKAEMQDRLAAAIKREAENFIPMLKQDEAKEAFSAFMEKRKPDFSKC